MLDVIIYILAFIGALALLSATIIAFAMVRGGAHHHGDSYDY
jgi:hypothetical protein